MSENEIKFVNFPPEKAKVAEETCLTQSNEAKVTLLNTSNTLFEMVKSYSFDQSFFTL